MGRGKSLSEAEKIKIKTYKDAGVSIHKIAEKIGRSRNVVSKYLKNESTYGKNMKSGAKRVLNIRDKRKILRLASNSQDTAAQIRDKAGLSVSVRTVQRVISNASHIVRLKLKKKPRLDAVRRERRLKFCRSHMTWNNEWHRVVFSDEKNLI